MQKRKIDVPRKGQTYRLGEKETAYGKGNRVREKTAMQKRKQTYCVRDRHYAKERSKPRKERETA